ncbi:flagellin [Falsirhodobacter sp. alg1]|uniref:flagellin n=1 Tax=Falsirhodobacter sp. alg1 TaxID=1472418 RepID=UPI0005EDB48E|nr:flagellin [Falsirhodobacter sp. alg1]
MSAISLADMAQSFALRRQNTALQVQQQRLATEVVSGVAADTGRAVRGDFTQQAAITTSLARNQALANATSLAGTLATAQQAGLSVIDDAVGTLGTILSDPSVTSNPTTLGATAEVAKQAFETVISALNVQVAGQGVFSGDAPNGPALADADTILSALQTLVAGADGAAGILQAVDAWFASGGGFDSTAYLGGAPRAPMVLGETDRVSLGLTAADTGLRNTLKGLALGALLASGTLQAEPEQRAVLANAAGAVLISADGERNETAARLGAVEARIDSLSTRHQAEKSALEMAQTSLLAVDPYEAATRLEATQTQIETLYTVTARISRLNLTDYL